MFVFTITDVFHLFFLVTWALIDNVFVNSTKEMSCQPPADCQTTAKESCFTKCLCQNTSRDSKSCWTHNCSWSAWTACSATCGEGKQWRTKRCNISPQNSCTEFCKEVEDDKEEKMCKIHYCTVKRSKGGSQQQMIENVNRRLGSANNTDSTTVTIVSDEIQNDTMHVTRGQSLVLSCVIENRPYVHPGSSRPEVFWRFKSQRHRWIILSSDSVKKARVDEVLGNPEGSELTIYKNSVQKSDAGVYQCAVNTSSGHLRHDQVHVIVEDGKHVITMSVSNQPVLVGIDESFNITCETIPENGQPIFISLLRNGSAIYTFNVEMRQVMPSVGSPQAVVTHEVSQTTKDEIDMTLTFRNFSSCDEGSYICQLNSTIKSRKKIVKINTPCEADNIVVRPRKVVLSKDDEATLKCHVKRVEPIPQITWVWRHPSTRSSGEITRDSDFHHSEPVTSKRLKSKCTYSVTRKIRVGYDPERKGHYQYYCRLRGEALSKSIISSSYTTIKYVNDAVMATAKTGNSTTCSDTPRNETKVTITSKAEFGNVYASIGSTLELVCVAENRHRIFCKGEKPKVRWTYRSSSERAGKWVELISSVTVDKNETRYTLLIPEVTIGDAGVYQCSVQTSADLIESDHVTVVVSGQKKTTRPQIRSQSKLPTIATTEKTTTTQKPRHIQGQKKTTRPQIRSQSKLPTIAKTVKTTTTQKPRTIQGFSVSIEPMKEPIHVGEDDSIQLTCKLRSLNYTSMKVAWRRGASRGSRMEVIYEHNLKTNIGHVPDAFKKSRPGLKLSMETTKTTYGTSVTLSLKNFNSCDQAWYKCTFKSNGMSKKAVTKVIVDTPCNPSDILITPPIVDSSREEKALLTCKVKKIEPKPDLMWVWKDDSTDATGKITTGSDFVHVHAMESHFRSINCVYEVKRKLTLLRNEEKAGNYTYHCVVSGGPFKESLESTTFTKVVYKMDALAVIASELETLENLRGQQGKLVLSKLINETREANIMLNSTLAYCTRVGCQHNGRCLASTGECECPPGYDGKHCENDIDECALKPCHEHAVCTNTAGSYECECAQGYVGDGVSCRNTTKDCTTNVCENGGSCTMNATEATCLCPDGFTGKHCERALARCDRLPCRNNGTCINTDQGYLCKCQQGYEGQHCEMKDSSRSDTDTEDTVQSQIFEHPVYIYVIIAFGILSFLGLMVWLVCCMLNRSQAVAHSFEDVRRLTIVDKPYNGRYRPSTVRSTYSGEERASLLGGRVSKGLLDDEEGEVLDRWEEDDEKEEDGNGGGEEDIEDEEINYENAREQEYEGEDEGEGEEVESDDFMNKNESATRNNSSRTRRHLKPHQRHGHRQGRVILARRTKEGYEAFCAAQHKKFLRQMKHMKRRTFDNEATKNTHAVTIPNRSGQARSFAKRAQITR